MWFASNFYQGALAAILPDRVPTDRRGAASAVIGMGTPLGTLLGVNLASHLSPWQAHLSIALVLVAATLLLAFAAPEGPAPAARTTSVRPGCPAGTWPPR